MKRQLLLLTVCILILNFSQASFTSHNCPADTLAYPVALSFKKIKDFTGRKLTFKEKMSLFLIKGKVKKEISRLLQNEEAEKLKANNNAKWSFICALLSFITPLMILPAILLKGSANKHRELLSPTSINRLKTVNAISKFWLVMFYIIVAASILLFVGIIIWFLFAMLKGIS